jgi:cytochrome c peroxidase
MAGKAWFTPEESWGFELFNGKANCAACPPPPRPTEARPRRCSPTSPTTTWASAEPLVCRLTGDWFTIDRGLGAIVNDPEQNGKFKVPTLRNIARTAPYGHNGFFPNLREIVDFYNARDVTIGRWPNAEVPETVNHDELGNLGMTKNETLALIAFLRTLTDER